MRRIHPRDREAIASAYREGELMVEIAMRFRTTIRTVRNIARAAGLPPRDQKTAVERICRNCGKRFLRVPSQSIRSADAYCDRDCYSEQMRTRQFQNRRKASVELRRLIWEFFPIQSQDFIHHLDGNPKNNDLNNIAVYRSPADVGRGEPLWRGDR